jgi:magnesium chelatase family protein
LSGPLLDRIDIHVNIPPVEVSALVRGAKGESSATVRERVAQLDEPTRKVLEGCATRRGFSARAFNKILRGARTYADLGGSERVRYGDVGEAVQGRLLDRTAGSYSTARQTP